MKRAFLWARRRHGVGWPALFGMLLCAATAAADDDLGALQGALDGLQGAAGATAPVAPQTLAEQLLPGLGQAMGLTPKRPVRVQMASRASLRGLLLEIMRRQYPGQQLEKMSAAFARIGLLPRHTDLRAAALRLYQGEISGFYDPLTGQLALLDDASPTEQAQVLQHELAHALQDQHFGLAKMIDSVVADDDRALALQAVIEGQAMVAMVAGLTSPGGPPPSLAATRAALAAGGVSMSDGEIKEALDMGRGNDSLADLLVPARASGDVVPYLQAQMLFPYQAGTRFIERLQRRWSFAEVVRRTLQQPPQSTAEVLHPSRYGQRPQHLDLRAVEACGTLAYATTVGELNVRTLLESANAAADLAAAWRGDRLVALAGSGGVGPVAWRSRWATPVVAKQFADILRRVSGARVEVVDGCDVALLAGATGDAAALWAALVGRAPRGEAGRLQSP